MPQHLRKDPVIVMQIPYLASDKEFPFVPYATYMDSCPTIYNSGLVSYSCRCSSVTQSE